MSQQDMQRFFHRLLVAISTHRQRLNQLLERSQPIQACWQPIFRKEADLHGHWVNHRLLSKQYSFQVHYTYIL